MNLSAFQIAMACGSRLSLAVNCREGLNEAMDLYDIHTAARQTMFLANVGEETGGLQWLTEVWGPTQQQRRYERNMMEPWPDSSAQAALQEFHANRLAYFLGNSQLGDGWLFRAHGMLGITGRQNHALARDRLRARFPDLPVPDFELEPEKLALPRWAALSAGDYVERTRCNDLADLGDFDGYCDMINKGHRTERIGDANGYGGRLARYEEGLKVLA